VKNEPLIDDLKLLCTVVRLASFASTAKEMGSSPAYVSKRIAILEDTLGVKLFHRTTRRMAITEDGLTVAQWARKIVDDVVDMAQAVSDLRKEPRGVLHISTSFAFGRKYVAPIISELARCHPLLETRLEIVDRPVDLIDEGYDIDVRIGQVHEPNLIAHRIAEGSRILCASPDYLARRGKPETLPDLVRHACLVIKERNHAFGVWRLEGPHGLETVKVSGPLSSNNGEVVVRWALAGHGIMLRSYWDVVEHLERGELVHLLPNYRQIADILAVSTTRLAASAKVRVAVRFLREGLSKGPHAVATMSAARATLPSLQVVRHSQRHDAM
jgi:LysR family transcriptional activator of dmlA